MPDTTDAVLLLFSQFQQINLFLTRRAGEERFGREKPGISVDWQENQRL
jgi:hypothetical protein